MPLDALDRRIVAALQTDGRASWTDIAALCDTSVATVARRGQRLLDDGVVKVTVVPHINYAGAANLYVLRAECEAGAQTRVARELALRADTRLVGLVTGRHDLVAELVVRDDDSLGDRLVGDILTVDGVLRCDTDLVLHTYKVSHDWSRQLVTGEPYVYTGDEPHVCSPGDLDDTDRAIVERMRDDGRLAFRAIAGDLAINESTVRRRFESMYQRGCVMVLTLVPAPALGFESEILLSIDVAPARLDEVAKRLASYRGVRYLVSTLAKSSLLAEVILSSSAEVFDFMTNTVGKLDGVHGWSASIELVTLKRGFTETPWWKPTIENLRSDHRP